MWLEEDEPSPATNRRNPIDLTGTSSNDDNHPQVPSPPRFPTPWSAAARASRPPIDYHSHDDRGADRSPEGYFADGTGFIHDTRGYKVPLHNQSRNEKYAGQYVPNQRECDHMQRAMEREEYRDKYGPDEYRAHFGSPTSSHSSYQNVNRYDNHPGRREEFRNPSVTPPYSERIYTNEEMIENYLWGPNGKTGLQFSDLTHLGFTDPRKSLDVLYPIHSRLMSSWDSRSSYEGYTSGPDATKLLGANRSRYWNPESKMM
jgi:hypothetical protein